MPTEILINDATPLVFANTADYSPSAGVVYTRTDQLNLTSLPNGAARQSTKANFGDPRAREFTVKAGTEMDVAAVAGKVIEFYFGASRSATAGLGNPGGLSGADSAYKAGEEDEWVAQLDYIGSLVLTADAAPTVQVATINKHFKVSEQYGIVVVKNEGGQAFEGDGIEMYVAFIPNKDEAQ